MGARVALLLVLCVLPVFSQEKAGPGVMERILQRLDAVEKENQQLLEEVRSLRKELQQTQSGENAPETASEAEEPTLPERVAVNEGRIAEQAQTKVEAAQRFPIQLNGMLLFNAFANSAGGNSTAAGLLTGPERSGATLRQTQVGLEVQGPALPWDGRVNGSVTMDFFAGTAEPGNNWLRLRRADISLDWAKRSFFVGQDKPLISPYEPSSLGEVGVPALAGSGNLWLWLPQARYEERIEVGPRMGITGQIGVIQTDEKYDSVAEEYARSLSLARPGLEGRAAFWRRYGQNGRVEIGSGFHVSTSHVAGASVDSRVASVDWLFNAGRHLAISGTYYHGQNVAGLGALNNGFTITSVGVAEPVHTSAGWSQIAVPITGRLTWNLFAGLEDDGDVYVPAATARALTYASNVMYHLGPNVVVSLEGLQLRRRTAAGMRANQNHYDLALAYLF